MKQNEKDLLEILERNNEIKQMILNIQKDIFIIQNQIDEKEKYLNVINELYNADQKEE